MYTRYSTMFDQFPRGRDGKSGRGRLALASSKMDRKNMGKEELCENMNDGKLMASTPESGNSQWI